MSILTEALNRLERLNEQHDDRIDARFDLSGTAKDYKVQKIGEHTYEASNGETSFVMKLEEPDVHSWDGPLESQDGWEVWGHLNDGEFCLSIPTINELPTDGGYVCIEAAVCYDTDAELQDIQLSAHDDLDCWWAWEVKDESVKLLFSVVQAIVTKEIDSAGLYEEIINLVRTAVNGLEEDVERYWYEESRKSYYY